MIDGEPEHEDDSVRVWLVERTFSDDEQNLVILVYATPDGARYLRKERALTSFDDQRPTRAALEVSPSKLGETPERERALYAERAASTAAEYGPDDAI